MRKAGPWKARAALRAGPGDAPAGPGSDLILSLDVRAQRAAEEALRGKRGAVIAIDPANGDVIAFASMPGFDPNGFARGLSTRRIPHAAGRHRPAHVQPRAARRVSARLDDQAGDGARRARLRTRSIPVRCDTAAVSSRCRAAGIAIATGSQRPWLGEHAGAVAQSCDTYFYSVAQTLGIDRLSIYLSASSASGQPHRHRHRGRKARPGALARVETEELLTRASASGSRATPSSSASARVTCSRLRCSSRT